MAVDRGNSKVPTNESAPGSVADRAERQVAAWLARLAAAAPGESAQSEAARSAERPDLLTGVRQDADGFAFTRKLFESVAGAADPFAAALGLRSVSRQLPPSLPARDRLAVRAGGIASLGLPWAVLPLARRWLRERVSHLVLSVRTPDEASRDGQLSELREALESLEQRGFAPVLRLTGEPVLGPGGVQTEVRRLAALAAEPSVGHLAVDPARLAPGSDWAFDDDVERVAAALRPVLEVARDHDTVLVLAPGDYRSARLAPEILVRALADSDLDSVRVGVQLLAELPESREIAERVLRWARQRVDDGGAPVEVAVTFGGIAGREGIASVLSGLPVPTLEGLAQQAAQWLRLMDLVLDASAPVDGRAAAVVPVAASEDPYLLAAALAGAEDRGLPEALAVQLRAGTVPSLAELLVASGASVRLLLPITPPHEFSGAIDWLLGLAAEAADPESTLARTAELLDGNGGSDSEAEMGAAPASAAARDHFAEVLRLRDEPFPRSHRVQRRAREWDPSERDQALFYRPPADSDRFDTGGLTAAVLGLGRDETGELVVEAAGSPLAVPVVSASGFAAEPDTDAAVAENRAWARRMLARAAELRDQAAEAEAEAADSGALVDAALTAGELWRQPRAAERAIRLRRLALGVAAARDRFFTVLAAESGSPIPTIDAEVNEAIDAARYLGQLAEGLGAVRGAQFRPGRLTVVVADAGVPLGERAEAVLAVLAAGSAVILAAHPTIARSSRALLEEWRAAGLPEGVAGLLIGEGEPVAALTADPRVDRALVLGNRTTARGLIRRRPDLRVDGRFCERGTVLVTPTADPSAAARDAVRSAFSMEARDARAAQAIVVLGAAARTGRFREQLADAVRAIRVGDTARPGEEDPLTFGLGPLATPPDAAGLRALTELELGEEWLVKPERLDDAGRLWRPGVRAGLRPDAGFWQDAAGMPVIGLITARTLDEAIELQRQLGGGGVAGLHSGAAEELMPWLERTRAASLTVGRPTGPGRIERLPCGGWGPAGMGVQPLAGGPNRLVALGSWELREGTPSSTLHLRGLDPEVQVLIEAAQAVLDYVSFDRVRRAALSDALTWRTTLGRVRDEIGLGVERNLLRRWPVAVQLRLAEGGAVAGLIRVLAAALLVRAPVMVSTGEVLPKPVSEFLATQGITVSLERDDAWLERLAVDTAGVEGSGSAQVERVRLIDGDAVRAAEWLSGQDRVAVWAEPVTMAGPVELLTFLREQSISVRTHRYGLISPPPGLDSWIADLDGRAVPRA